MAIRVRKAIEIPADKVKWLWPLRIPLGMLTIVDGEPGARKSTVLLDVVARVTRGWPMPPVRETNFRNELRERSPLLTRWDPRTRVPPQAAIVLNAEDAPARVRAQLKFADADLDRVHLIAPEDFGTDDWLSLLPDKLPKLRQVAAQTKAKLLVIDPLSSFLRGGLNNETCVREALTPLSRMAQELQLAVLLVRHFSKRGSKNPLYGGSGSVAVTGIVRSGLLVMKDPLDPEHRSVLAVAKSSLAGSDTPALVFSVRRESEVLSDTPTCVNWLGELKVSAKELVAAGMEEEGGSMLVESLRFLRDFLANGAKPAKEVLAAAANEGHAKRTIYRAKRYLCVKSSRTGFGPGCRYDWQLPTLSALPTSEELVAEQLAAIEAKQKQDEERAARYAQMEKELGVGQKRRLFTQQSSPAGPPLRRPPRLLTYRSSPAGPPVPDPPTSTPAPPVPDPSPSTPAPPVSDPPT